MPKMKYYSGLDGWKTIGTDADLVTISDQRGLFTATDVEAALIELYDTKVSKLGGTITGTITYTNGPAPLVLKAGASADQVYLPLYADSQNQNTRSGFMGYSATGSTTLYLYNEMLNGDLDLHTSGTGKPKANGVEIVTISGTQTLTNKTLTAPQFATGGYIANSYGLELLRFVSVGANAVNEISVTNAIAGGSPSLSATGDDTNIGFNINAKGTGTINLTGNIIKQTTGMSIIENSGAANLSLNSISADPYASILFSNSSAKRWYMDYANGTSDDFRIGRFTGSTGSEVVDNYLTFDYANQIVRSFKKMSLESGVQALDLKAGPVADQVFLAFYADSQAQSTRSATIGFGSSGTTELAISNEMPNGNIVLLPSGVGIVKVGANEVYNKGNLSPATSVQKTATLPNTQGWYRIATSAVNISKNSGLFAVELNGSGVQNSIIFSAGCNFGLTNTTTIQQLLYDAYSINGITKARIVHHTTYTGNYAYLEIYLNGNTGGGITVRGIELKGWTMLSDPSTVGSIPSGYTSKELSFAYGLATTNNITASGDIKATNNMTIGGNQVWHAGIGGHINTDTLYKRGWAVSGFALSSVVMDSNNEVVTSCTIGSGTAVVVDNVGLVSTVNIGSATFAPASTPYIYIDPITKNIQIGASVPTNAILLYTITGYPETVNSVIPGAPYLNGPVTQLSGGFPNMTTLAITNGYYTTTSTALVNMHTLKSYIQGKNIIITGKAYSDNASGTTTVSLVSGGAVLGSASVTGTTPTEFMIVCDAEANGLVGRFIELSLQMKTNNATYTGYANVSSVIAK